MTTSMEAGEALGDLNVPYFAMAISSARNLHRVWQGRLPLSDLPFSVVMDGSVKGGLSAIGGLSGKALGLLALGPAGALILGSVGGVGALLGSGWTREQATAIQDAKSSLDQIAVARWLKEETPEFAVIETHLRDGGSQKIAATLTANGFPFERDRPDRNLEMNMRRRWV